METDSRSLGFCFVPNGQMFFAFNITSNGSALCFEIRFFFFTNFQLYLHINIFRVTIGTTAIGMHSLETE